MVVLTSFVEPTDRIHHREPHTSVYVNSNNLGSGTLYIAESNLSWIGDSGNGFSIQYPHISLHAISRDMTAFPRECLFLMLDAAVGDEEINEENGEENNDENGSGDQGTTELRLVPDDKGKLDAMFHAMNACQALHPDPEDSFSDEDFFEDADEEVLMDETDTRMASLRIENMDGRQHIQEMRRSAGPGVGISEHIRTTAYWSRDCTGSNTGSSTGSAGGTMAEASRMGTGVGSTLDDTAQGDRPFFGGNILTRWNRTASAPPANEPSTVLDYSNFDDVEY